jgi:hypothetical protein
MVVMAAKSKIDFQTQELFGWLWPTCKHKYYSCWKESDLLFYSGRYLERQAMHLLHGSIRKFEKSSWILKMLIVITFENNVHVWDDKDILSFPVIYSICIEKPEVYRPWNAKVNKLWTLISIHPLPHSKEKANREEKNIETKKGRGVIFRIRNDRTCSLKLKYLKILHLFILSKSLILLDWLYPLQFYNHQYIFVSNNSGIFFL